MDDREHSCGNYHGVIIEREEGKWYICIEDYGDWEHICFCPYCGINLRLTYRDMAE